MLSERQERDTSAQGCVTGDDEDFRILAMRFRASEVGQSGRTRAAQMKGEGHTGRLGLVPKMCTMQTPERMEFATTTLRTYNVGAY